MQPYNLRRIKEAARDLQFNQVLKNQIQDRIYFVFLYMQKMMNKPILINPLFFWNRYSQNNINKMIEVKFEINNRILTNGRIAAYNAKNQTVIVYPYSIYDTLSLGKIPENKIRNILELIKVALYHEFAHSVDPKTGIANFNIASNKDSDDPEKEDSPEEQKRKLLRYYRSEVEFDAYSKEMIEKIRMEFNKRKYLKTPEERNARLKSLVEGVETWLYNPLDNSKLLQDNDGYYNAIVSGWQKIKPSFYRRLKERVFYNFIENWKNDLEDEPKPEEENGVETQN